MMQSKEHWEQVYRSKNPDKVSWFQSHAELSLRLIRQNRVPESASIIDVGGGASTLVDDLLAAGYLHLTVLDLSRSALETARSRLADRAELVQWMEADILEVELGKEIYDVWHDRAVFHFLTDEADRQRYVQQVLRAVKPGGLVFVATFAEDGPEQCSGLPVVRYRPDELHAEFGQTFELLGSEAETHITPAGREQRFVYCFCRRW